MKSLTVWNPFRELDEMQNRLTNFFGGPLNRVSNGNGGLKLADWSPEVDITEDDKEYLVKADLPEMKKDDVKVVVENGVLSISGERKSEKEEKTRNTTGSSDPTAASNARSPCRKTRMRQSSRQNSKTEFCVCTCPRTRRRSPPKSR